VRSRPNEQRRAIAAHDPEALGSGHERLGQTEAEVERRGGPAGLRVDPRQAEPEARVVAGGTQTAPSATATGPRAERTGIRCTTRPPTIRTSVSWLVLTTQAAAASTTSAFVVSGTGATRASRYTTRPEFPSTATTLPSLVPSAHTMSPATASAAPRCRARVTACLEGPVQRRTPWRRARSRSCPSRRSPSRPSSSQL
jgi:hypothetical protein